MKVLIYILAVAAIAAGAWYSYDIKTKFTELQASIATIEESNDNRDRSIRNTRKDAKDAEDVRDAANVVLSDLKSDLDTNESNLTLVNREVDTWTKKIASQKNKLDELETLITSVKNEFSELNVDSSDVPALVENLKNDVEEANTKMEELNTLTTAAQERAEANETQLSDLRDRIARRAERIRGNSAKGLITAVNHDWGVAIVDVPSNMTIDTSSKLMIRRGSKYIGKLKVTSVEGNRVVADFDYVSMSSGSVARAGDVVVLAKPLAN
ncbi:MAG: hypothetical protein ACSHX0_08370 [Akkermansiaceae bacterium]